jgi:hypothetical protein
MDSLTRRESILNSPTLWGSKNAQCSKSGKRKEFNQLGAIVQSSLACSRRRRRSWKKICNLAKSFAPECWDYIFLWIAS